MSTELRFCPRCAGALETRSAGHPASPHPTCVACGFVLWQNMKPTVEALIVRGEGLATELLLGRRTMPGGRVVWDLPGGFLNADDRLRDALTRECQREMGIEVDVGELLCACEDNFADSRIVSLVYVCRIVSGEPWAADIVDAVQWFALDANIDPANQAVADAIRVLRERILG